MTRRSDRSPDGGVRSRAFSKDEGKTQAMRRSEGWMRPGDEALLRSLHRDGPESCPLLAARIGMHLKYARGRCEELEARGYLRSRDERSYELTEKGEGHIARDGAADE